MLVKDLVYLLKKHNLYTTVNGTLGIEPKQSLYGIWAEASKNTIIINTDHKNKEEVIESREYNNLKRLAKGLSQIV